MATPSGRIDDLILFSRQGSGQFADLINTTVGLLEEGAVHQIIVDNKPPDPALFRGTNAEIAPMDYLLAIGASEAIITFCKTPLEALGGVSPLAALRRIRS